MVYLEGQERQASKEKEDILEREECMEMLLKGLQALQVKLALRVRGAKKECLEDQGCQVLKETRECMGVNVLFVCRVRRVSKENRGEMV